MKTPLGFEGHTLNRTSRFGKRAALLALGFLVVFAQSGGQATTTPPDALPYSTGFLVTGDYVTGTVDLDPRNAVDGSLTGTIPMSGVPANADIVAAFLYWEMISPQGAPAVATGAKFRGQPIGPPVSKARVKSISQPLTGSAAACYPGTLPLTLTMFRADVLHLLPAQLDAKGQPTGKLLVNNIDLLINGLPLHTVTLPEPTVANPTQSAGATLFVVYRDPTRRLRKIVVFDGAYIQPPGATMSQRSSELPSPRRCRSSSSCSRRTPRAAPS